MVRKHPEVIEKGKKIDMSDIEMDPYAMFQKKWVIRHMSFSLYVYFILTKYVCLKYDIVSLI